MYCFLHGRSWNRLQKKHSVPCLYTQVPLLMTLRAWTASVLDLKDNIGCIRSGHTNQSKSTRRGVLEADEGTIHGEC
jgi:hypothetical protein